MKYLVEDLLIDCHLDMVRLRKHTDELLLRLRSGDSIESALAEAEKRFPLPPVRHTRSELRKMLHSDVDDSASSKDDTSMDNQDDENEDREFHLVDFGHNDLWWMKVGLFPSSGEPAYLNPSGGGYPITGEEKVLRKVFAESFADLDWNDTALKQPDSDAGWLDREGRFYGCDSQSHDTYVHFIFKKEVVELEKSGWVRVYGKRSEPQWGCGYGFGLRLSAEQKMWLDRKGYTVEERD